MMVQHRQNTLLSYAHRYPPRPTLQKSIFQLSSIVECRSFQSNEKQEINSVKVNFLSSFYFIDTIASHFFLQTYKCFQCVVRLFLLLLNFLTLRSCSFLFYFYLICIQNPNPSIKYKKYKRLDEDKMANTKLCSQKAIILFLLPVVLFFITHYLLVAFFISLAAILNKSQPIQSIL